MASIGHIAVGMALGRAYSPDPKVARRAAVALTLVSLWPDVDAVGFALGVGYGESLGHRGATHSLLVALAVGLAGYVVAERRGLPAMRTAVFVAVVAMSHALLDTMTYGGGLGCALFWPLSDARFWSPVRFIPIAPIGMRLLSARGLWVMARELVIFLPFWAYALWPRRKPASA
ncbi:MAG: metal-dependent hydrolase [Myxococcales bacterium]|nr:metal-dependent hydrolase [Myxococcales bacterium]